MADASGQKVFLLILALWIIFNGQITAEILILGIVFSSVIYLFLCKFLHFSFKTDITWLKKSGYIIEYLAVLFIEIVKANVCVGKMMLSSRDDVEPAIVKFTSGLKTEKARVILANSITLTPGTITVRLQFDEFTVHCLDKSLAAGLDSSIFVKLLERMENL